MTGFRRVSGDHASPNAVGILLPPGERTVLIVRPRSLGWDLLLMRGAAGTTFRELTRDEAPAVAHAFCRALEEWAGGGRGHVEAIGSFAGEGYLVWVDVGEFSLVACARLPGQPYRPLLFRDAGEARQTAARIAEALCPPAGCCRELYVNTRHFAS